MNAGHLHAQHGLISTGQAKAGVFFMVLTLVSLWFCLSVSHSAQRAHAQAETATQEKFETATK